MLTILPVLDKDHIRMGAEEVEVKPLEEAEEVGYYSPVLCNKVLRYL